MPCCSTDNRKPEVYWPSSSQTEAGGVVYVIIGVSGAGKTTIGRLLAETIKCSFLDADDFHSESNKEKMRNGIPLTDNDRTPWLESLRDALSEYISKGETVVLACSALRNKYREILRSAAAQSDDDQTGRELIKFVLLDVPAELLAKRLSKREAEGEHFMPSALLESQLNLLEVDETEGVIRVDGSKNGLDIVSDIRNIVVPPEE